MRQSGSSAAVRVEEFNGFEDELEASAEFSGFTESSLGEAEISDLILTHRENGRKLSRSILRRWRVRMPADEIDSIVDLALCEAARRFSPERGASFMTFFFYHLRGHLVRAVARAAQASNVFLAYAHGTGIDTSEWQKGSMDSIWAAVPEQLLLQQKDIETPEHAILRKERISVCRDAVQKLDELEREIIIRSYGEEEALVDIAKNLGYSRCHISRVKKSALDRLKLLLSQGQEQLAVSDESEEHEDLDANGSMDESIYVERAQLRGKRRSRRRPVTRAAVVSVGVKKKQLRA